MGSPSINKLLRNRALGIATDQDAVDWAVGQIAVSRASPQLAALCSLRPPLNHFEVEDLLRGALAEIGVEEQKRNLAYWNSLHAISSEIVSGAIHPRVGCDLLARAHGGSLDRNEIQSFWLLHLAIGDLEASAPQWYWPGLTIDNFNVQVVKQAVQLQVKCAEESRRLSGH
jgi:hypothetical protein